MEEHPTISMEEFSIENGQLRRKVAIRDVELAEKKEELRRLSETLKTVVALKNKKIRDLESELMGVRREGEPASKKRKEEEGKDEDEGSSLSDVKEDNEVKDGWNLDVIPSETIQARFSKISELSRTAMVSKPLRIKGVLWRIAIWKENVEDREFLAVYLNIAEERINKTLSWTVFHKSHLFSHSNEYGHSIGNWSNSSIFNSENRSWGRPTFIPIEDLMNPEYGFVKEDTILVAIEVKIFSD
ncbi:hypothetical protein PFISCL1PPCAC_20304 [Pristionchus fissidentatus]|uniref:MATH domain-containing protein n=1 Tax=Pristionchus fissidentatus TaxID=1538716 RepID=A0AAV5WGD5_9BILA|nr:hypothetical protein PFISCL1PPCAC_20304 [Pristionchus fissidentatus]